MGRGFVAYIFVFLLIKGSFAQISDRYPNVQSPDEKSVIIAWRTSTPSLGKLAYGTDSINMMDTVNSSIVMQKHYFELTGLSDNTKYYYEAFSDSISYGVNHFYTAKNEYEDQLRFLFYADCGYDNTEQNAVSALMEQEDVDFGLVAGDVDQGIGDNYDAIFFKVYKSMLKRDCHFTSLGNHDIIYDNGDTYLDAFYLPHNNPDNTERYYSFTWGNAKFICLDSNSPYTVGTDQYNWLLSELQNNDRHWLFTFFHHPPWTNAWDLLYYVPLQPYFQYEGNEDMRTDLVPLFEEYNVDYVLNGHSHCYQRGNMNDVFYLISGGAGSSTLDQNTNSSAPNISVEKYVNHYTVFEINEDEVIFKAIDINETVIDSVYHQKPYLSSIASADAQQALMNIYPNPVTDNAVISFNEALSEKSVLTITDIMGRPVREPISITEEQFHFQRGDLVRGIYLFHLTGNMNMSMNVNMN
ncbi:MAG TPA: T9SS type A sorting domain-containing protein, partial [Bacteroidetes bacterium]|nr:T9SS type A sorting domain-containing protein [Bacteroidota bacterium]